MNVFNFDEEVLSDDLGRLKLEDNPLHFEGVEEQERILDPYEITPLNAHSFNRDEIATLMSHQRRRSSVYSRLSVNLSSSISSFNQELTIPANYESNPEDCQRDSGVTVDHINFSKKTLSDFEPLKVLGQGAYGRVHLVRDKSSNRLFAQKQVRKPTINILKTTDENEHHIKRTISERQILTNITHHPNIVKLFYALQDRDKFYLLLEYIPGGELFHHLASPENQLGNAFKESDVAFYAAEMALGLRHLHRLGIVYRDLKPENCLLNSSGHLVLTDFGLSKTITDDKNNRCTSIIGTPEYMAPEILKGESYGFAVDWWSLGCVIYDMMLGKPPFTGNSHKAIQNKIVKEKLNIPFYFSLDAKDMLHKLLNKNPNKRFSVDEKWDQFSNHRFFRKINWISLEKQDLKAKPPIEPVITDPSLAENFDTQFTSLPVSDLNFDETYNIPMSHPSGSLFKGFSYTASNSFIERFN
ncbi:uncharacterized protein PRCAT00006046001 [Priceomyces carsonii]|uniref:uncharacterized protein n=1 Tax=Priceomyces carsonii TaxID=28549 RepID=UPI002EDA6E1F|nr:unnamed protein product [Priceomyces carsonii]